MSENFGKAYIILPENFGKAMISVYHSIGFSALSAHRSFFCTTKKPRNQKTKEIKNSRKHKRKNKNKNKTQQLPPYVNVTSSEVYSLFFFLTHVFFPLICANTPANSQSTWSQDKHAPLLCHGYDSRLKKPIPRILTNLNARFFCQKIQNTPQHACLLPSYFGQCVHSAE